eukprot:TRINITY_DN2845_c1_g1_i1.p1 TRINITY_DN2845_c1_g1~~TRINITY_DN2845_c1_g1_i1.p1  ORF type:complete len:565 (-),score=104.03 TRINITY_DN2845_c1_g1_i1:293-1987(-)
MPRLSRPRPENHSLVRKCRRFIRRNRCCRSLHDGVLGLLAGLERNAQRSKILVFVLLETLVAPVFGAFYLQHQGVAVYGWPIPYQQTYVMLAIMQVLHGVFGLVGVTRRKVRVTRWYFLTLGGTFLVALLAFVPLCRIRCGCYGLDYWQCNVLTGFGGPEFMNLYVKPPEQLESSQWPAAFNMPLQQPPPKEEEMQLEAEVSEALSTEALDESRAGSWRPLQLDMQTDSFVESHREGECSCKTQCQQFYNETYIWGFWPPFSSPRPLQQQAWCEIDEGAVQACKNDRKGLTLYKWRDGHNRPHYWTQDLCTKAGQNEGGGWVSCQCEQGSQKRCEEGARCEVPLWSACPDTLCETDAPLRKELIGSQVACQAEAVVAAASRACIFSRIVVGALLVLVFVLFIPYTFLVYFYVRNRCGDVFEMSVENQFSVAFSSDEEDHDDWSTFSYTSTEEAKSKGRSRRSMTAHTAATTAFSVQLSERSSRPAAESSSCGTNMGDQTPAALTGEPSKSPGVRGRQWASSLLPPSWGFAWAGEAASSSTEPEAAAASTETQRAAQGAAADEDK